MGVGERPGRIARNTLFNSLTAAIGVGAGFVTSVVIARGLGPADMGVYTLIIWTTIAAITIVSKGFAFAIVKFVAQYDLRTRRDTIVSIVAFALRRQLALAIVGAALVAACSGLLADLFDTPDAQYLFALAALLVVTTSLIDTSAAPLAGLERQGLIVPLVAAHALALLVAAFLVMNALDAGIKALIVSQVVVGFATLALYLVVLSRVVETRFTAGIAARLRRRITKYATSMTVTLTLGLVVWQRSEIFILGVYRESSEVAYYSIAFAMSEALQGVLPVALAGALFPNISRAFADRDHAFARRAYENSVRLTTMAVLPVAVAGALLSAPAIEVLYGSAFEDAALPLAVLLFSAGAQRVGQTSAQILLGSDRERLIMWFTATWAVFNVAIAVALIPQYGIAGATAANAATQFTAIAAAHLLVRRTTGFGLPTAALLRIVAANLPVLVAVGLVVMVVDGDLVTLVVGAAVVPPAYALGLWLTRALGPLERQYLAERMKPLAVWRR